MLNTTRFTIVLWLGLLSVVCRAGGQEPPETQEPPRWQDASFGLSLQPPAGATLVQNARDTEILRIRCKEGITINFRLRSVEAPLNIEGLAKQAIQSMSLAHPTSLISEQRLVTIAGRAAARLQFYVPNDKTGPWTLAQTLILLDSHNVAVLHMDVAQHDLERAAPLFDAVVKSVRLEDPRHIEKEREAAILRSEAVLARLTAERISVVLAPDRWFRIIENDVDVGYMRIRQFRDTEMNLPGIRVDIQVRMLEGEKAADTLGNYFLADHKRTEIWSVRTTMRDKQARPRPQLGRGRQIEPGATVSWAETGLRSDDEITVTVSTPSGKRDARWDRPPKGYLPHVLQTIIPLLLPRDATQTFAFYSYYPNATSLVLRTERIEPRPDRSFMVHTRAAPDESESTSEFDANGRLIRQMLSDGRIVLPSTLNQINTIWRMR